MSTKKSLTYLKNLQLKAAGLFKYVWAFCEHQTVNFETTSYKKKSHNIFLFFEITNYELIMASY